MRDSSAISKPYTSYNPYFLVPFAIWTIVGAIALLFFDRQLLFSIVNTHHSSWGDFVMYGITDMGEGVFSAVTLLLLLGIRSLRNWWYVVSAFFSNALPNLITQFIKSAINAPRPLNYFKEAPWIHTSDEWPRLMERSFPSGHTCAAFCLFCFFAILLPPRYRPFGILFFILALLVGFSRIYLAAHFFLDVYVGSLIGTVLTLVIISIMNKYSYRFFKAVEEELSED